MIKVASVGLGFPDARPSAGAAAVVTVVSDLRLAVVGGRALVDRVDDED